MNLKPQTLLFSFFFAVNRFWETFVKLKMNSQSLFCKHLKGAIALFSLLHAHRVKPAGLFL